MSNTQTATLSPDPDLYVLASPQRPGPPDVTTAPVGVGVHRAAIYCRVSTDEQAEHGTSLADQASRCAEYAAGRGWPVVAEFIDEGASGATLDRPALHALMVGSAERVFDWVIVTDPRPVVA